MICFEFQLFSSPHLFEDLVPRGCWCFQGPWNLWDVSIDSCVYTCGAVCLLCSLVSHNVESCSQTATATEAAALLRCSETVRQTKVLASCKSLISASLTHYRILDKSLKNVHSKDFVAKVPQWEVVTKRAQRYTEAKELWNHVKLKLCFSSTALCTNGIKSLNCKTQVFFTWYFIQLIKKMFTKLTVRGIQNPRPARLHWLGCWWEFHQSWSTRHIWS